MRNLMGSAIITVCRLAMRIGLGLRMPAARIRIHDQHNYRDNAEEQFRISIRLAMYWADEIARYEAEIANSEEILRAMEAQRHSLSIQAPSSPIADL